MKIEMNDNAAIAIILACVCAVMITALIIYYLI